MNPIDGLDAIFTLEPPKATTFSFMSAFDYPLSGLQYTHRIILECDTNKHVGNDFQAKVQEDYHLSSVLIHYTKRREQRSGHL
jgi:hypothetical protein